MSEKRNERNDERKGKEKEGGREKKEEEKKKEQKEEKGKVMLWLSSWKIDLMNGVQILDKVAYIS